MFASPGLAEVNTNTIARAAGVGVGTFYAHFEDKFALYRELMANGLAMLQQRLSEASQAARDQPIEAQVRATVAAFVDFAQSDPSLYRVVFAGGEGPGRAGRAGVGFSARAMENRLAELQQAGQLAPAIDVAAAARFFNAGQSQLLLWWLDAADPPSPAGLIDTLVALHPAVVCRR